MQEQRGLIQQAFGRFDTLDHNATRERMQTSIFFRRKFLAGEYDDRKVTQRRSVAEALQHVEAGDIGQAKVEHDAIEGLVIDGLDRLLATGNNHDVNVVIAEELLDAELLGRIVFDDQQALSSRSGILLDTGQRAFQSLWRRRLGNESKSAAGETVMTVFVEGQHLDRNMPRGRVLFQVVENRPAQHIGKENVQ